MGRWEPNARNRLEQAALDLYIEQGFEQTTVAEIAQRAGLTERTFFRHFADKREVLFWGSGALQELLLKAVAGAPDGTPPIDAVAAAFEVAASTYFADSLDHARQRQAAVAANTALQERELIKLATMATALAGALRGRGVPEPAATLTAEAGVMIFKVSFGRWIADKNDLDLATLLRDSLEQLKAATSGR